MILSSRNEKELKRVKSQCKHPENVAILPLDLSDIDSLPNKVKEAIQIFGTIDIMLHNGGISQRSLIRETDLSVDRKLMEVNFFGTVSLTKALLPHFIEKKSGHFAVVTSLVGKFGTPYRSAYSASKHALHGFFDTLRAEHYKDHIVVSIICPGFIQTNVSINALTSDGTPMNQMDDAQEKGMSPEECADHIFKAINYKKEEVYIGGKEIYGLYLKRLFPGIFSKFLRKAKVR